MKKKDALIARLVRENADLREALTRVQERCNELLEEARATRRVAAKMGETMVEILEGVQLRAKANAGLMLPGWYCLECQAFNGSAKEELKACRACGRPNPQPQGTAPPHNSHGEGHGSQEDSEG